MTFETLLSQLLRRGLRGLFETCSEPDSAESYARRAAARVGQGDDDGAIADCTKSIRMNPSYLAYCVRGAAYIGKEKYREAIDDLSVAIQLNPTNGWPYYLRGKAYAGLSEPVDCEDILSAIVADTVAADRFGVHDPEAREVVRGALDSFVSAWAAGQCPAGLSEEVKAYLDAAAQKREPYR